MKKLLSIALMALVFVSCSDKIYEEINTDPTKAPEMNPTLQLTHSALELYGDMNYVDVHRLYVYAFTQQLMGCWNTTNYGGQHRMDDNEMGRPWNNLYTAAMRNLTDGIENAKDKPNLANTAAAMRILRVYIGALLTDYYGDVPFKEAGMGFINGNSHPKYDKQDDLYNTFFEELKAAVKAFDIQKNAIESDPIFNGDIEAWKKFANSLRLRYAMRLSGIAPTVAQTEFKAALQDGVMTGAIDDAYVKHMNVRYSFGQESFKDFRGNALAKYFYGNDPVNNPTYICKTLWEQLYNNKDPRTNRLCRFYIDDFMSLSTGEGRVDMTDAVMTMQASNPTTVYLIAPGEFSWDNWPSYNKVDGSVLDKQIQEIIAAHPDYNPEKNTRWLMPKLANNFLRSDNPGILMTYAEVCFLRAEAVELGWGTGDDAKTLYETGIRAAMDILYNYYGCKLITDEEKDAYLAQPAIVYGAEDKIKQINTQAWILHFHNPAECWSNLRRSDYPALTPPNPKGKNPLIDGDSIPVRLCYPLKEETYNRDEYEKAKARVANYSWHARLWWDVK